MPFHTFISLQRELIHTIFYILETTIQELIDQYAKQVPLIDTYNVNAEFLALEKIYNHLSHT